MSEQISVHTTIDGPEEAETLARSAVEARLAVCAQVDGPVTSVYRWQGDVRTDQEWRVTFKTTAARYAELEAHIKETHPYHTPEIIATPITHGSAAYLAWVDEGTA